MASQAVESKRGYCRVCMTHCGLVFDIAGDRIVKVYGDRQHPITRGYTCPKGRASGRLHHHPDAITRPLMRKRGELVPVGWDEALDDIAMRLRTLIDTQGPHAVGIYFGSGLGLDSSGYAMEEALYRALDRPPKFSPLTIDGTSKVMIAGAMGAFPGLNPKTDYDHVEMLIYVGTNPMVSHAHNTGMYNPARFIRAAAGRGEVWTIDPLFTETARWSTRHVAAYPGKDYAILAWLTREILEGGPLDLQQPVAGMEELRAALGGYDRARAARIAGVPEQDLEDLLAAVRRKGRVVVETGTGITMSAGCNLTQWFAWVLMVLTGAMNRRGGAWFHPGFINRFEAFELPAWDDPWTPGPTTRPDVSGIVGDWPCAVLPAEIEAGNIRALMNFGGSLLRSFPDTNALGAALRKLDLHVNTEIIANETTALCTHVLPTKDALERPEITRWDTLAWNLSMQFVPALVEPLGERRSAWWAISQFMKRAGLPVPEHVPDDDRAPGADEAMLAKLMPNARCSFEELVRERYVERPLEFPAAWVDAHIDIILHPEDASARGIADGQTVRVHNDNGEITLRARVDPAMRRGVASIPHGHEAANVNFLTSKDIIDPLGGMALYSGVPIEVEPARRDAQASHGNLG